MSMPISCQDGRRAPVVAGKPATAQDQHGRKRIAFLFTHPIQYFSPLLRRMAQEEDIEPVAIYQSDCSVRGYFDKQFGRVLAWDVPLLEGYRYEFLTAIGRSDKLTYWRPFNRGLGKLLADGGFVALIVHGYNRPFHWYAIWKAHRLGIKVFIRDDANLFSKRRGPLKKWLKWLFFRLLDWQGVGFLAVGRANRDYYVAHGIAARKIFDVPHSVDNAFFQGGARRASLTRGALRQALGLEEGRPVVLFVAKLLHQKGLLDLVDAFQLASRAFAVKPYLVIVGDGELRGEIEQLAAHDKAIRLCGFKNQTQLPAYYDLADVFVLPSRDLETWGLVVNEAMNAGKPVIVSDRCGCWMDLIEDGSNGYVFRAGDVDALARCLSNVLSDTDRLRRMGQRSIEIIDKYSFETAITGIRQCLSAD
jgi:glycosyltransferase involved in cell wall biosynthesis